MKLYSYTWQHDVNLKQRMSIANGILIWNNNLFYVAILEVICYSTMFYSSVIIWYLILTLLLELGQYMYNLHPKQAFVKSIFVKHRLAFPYNAYNSAIFLKFVRTLQMQCMKIFLCNCITGNLHNFKNMQNI